MRSECIVLEASNLAVLWVQDDQRPAAHQIGYGRIKQRFRRMVITSAVSYCAIVQRLQPP
jgi:hypothetical protein